MILYYIIIPIILLLCFLICYISNKYPYKHKENTNTYNENDDVYLNAIYLKLINKINNEDQYLSWKFNGYDRRDKYSYTLALLPYKNKQNIFLIQIQNFSGFDKIILSSGYSMSGLELVNYDKNIYIIKKILSFSYLHIDEKNNLSFEPSIEQHVAKFLIEPEDQTND